MLKKSMLVALTLVMGLYSLSLYAAGKVHNISNEELKTLLDSGVALVDIRTPGEWKQTGIVAGSHTLTLFDESGKPKPDFIPRLREIAGPETPVIVICRTGNRTGVAARALTQQIGYENVYNVTRGITHWIAKGHPIVSYK